MILLLAVAPLAAHGQALTLQLRGPGLGESAGYVLAQKRGYFQDLGLQVHLRPAPTQDNHPFETLARGQADVAVEWLPVALVARENGLPVVNLAQMQRQPAFRLTCLRDAGVVSAPDLRGRSIGNWFGGGEYPLLVWLHRLGLAVDDSLTGVGLMRQWSDPAQMLRHRQAACVSSLDHDPLPDDPAITVLDPQAQGAALPEDGLYALAPDLARPEFRDMLARLLQASLRGWREAAADPQAAARLVLGEDADPQTLQRQTRIIARLAPTMSDTGRLDHGDLQRTAEMMRAAGLLRQMPRDAATDLVVQLGLTAPDPAGTAGGEAAAVRR